MVHVRVRKHDATDGQVETQGNFHDARGAAGKICVHQRQAVVFAHEVRVDRHAAHQAKQVGHLANHFHRYSPF